MAYENSPVFSDETPGKKFFCTCGESAKKPHCDGSHSSQNTGKSPKEFTIKEARRYVICDCGRKGTLPSAMERIPKSGNKQASCIYGYRVP